MDSQVVATWADDDVVLEDGVLTCEGDEIAPTFLVRATDVEWREGGYDAVNALIPLVAE